MLDLPAETLLSAAVRLGLCLSICAASLGLLRELGLPASDLWLIVVTALIVAVGS